MTCHAGLKALVANVFTLVLVTRSNTTPTLVFPIQSQLPPVAYVSKPYEFVFSPNTFKSDGQKLAYELKDHPRWLSIDDEGKRLVGTPNAIGSGQVKFELEAKDDTGQVSAAVALIVLEEQILSVVDDTGLTTSTINAVSAPDTVLLQPGEPLSFDLSSKSFNGISVDTRFYAISSDRSPLPPWLQFDSKNVHFSGTSPPLPARTPSSQSWDFLLVASNHPGFSEVTVGFQIVVATYVLGFNEIRLDVDVTRGKPVLINSLRTRLQRNGNPVHVADLDRVDTTAPSWLVLDRDDISLVGTTPEDAQDTTFVVSVSTKNSNVANISILLRVTGNTTNTYTYLGTQNATVGAYFFYVVKTSSETTKEGAVAELGELSSWLTFDPGNMTLLGLVPKTEQKSRSNVSIILRGVNGIDTFNLTIDVMSASSVGGAPKTTTTSQPKPISGTDGTEWHTDKKVQLGLKIGLPLFVVSCLIGLLFWCCRRFARQWVTKRKRRHEPSEAANENPELERGEGDATTRNSQEQISETLPPLSPPQVELPWAPDSLQKARERLHKRPNTPNTNLQRSSWDDLILPPPGTDGVGRVRSPSSARARASRQGAGAGPKFGVLRDIQPKSPVRDPNKTGISKHWRRSIPSSILLYNVSGRPNRMSGAGHGSGIPSVLRSPRSTSSWHDTLSSFPMMTSRTNTMILDAFPAPPSHGTGASSSSANQSINPTLRLVREDDDGCGSFEEARQKYYTQRARDQLEGTSRFVNGSDTSAKHDRRSTPRRSQPQNSKHTRSEKQGRLPRSGSRWSCNPVWLGRWTGNDPQIMIKREVSMASSHQFDSALSSDSQWEDEELIVEENVGREDRKRASSAAIVATTSPRLPFQSLSSGTQDESVQGQQESRWDRPRLVDQRKRVSVEGVELQRVQQSHKGSFRFV